MVKFLRIIRKGFASLSTARYYVSAHNPYAFFYVVVEPEEIKTEEVRYFPQSTATSRANLPASGLLHYIPSINEVVVSKKYGHILLVLRKVFHTTLRGNRSCEQSPNASLERGNYEEQNT